MSGSVPGDPAALTGLAADLAAYASVLEQAGDGLRTIDRADGWEGDAAEAFRSAFDGEPRRWLDASAAFRAASDALDRHARVLTWAQDRAADAVRMAADRPEAASDLRIRTQAQLVRAVDDALRAIDAAAASAPDGPGLARHVGDAVGAAGSALAAFGADVGNAVASLGNAAANDPLATAAVAGGGLLVAASAVGEVGGVALDLTGVGLPVGLGLNAASTAGIVAGVGIAGLGATSIASDALGPDRVQVFHADANTGGADTAPEPPFAPPKEITGRTKHGQERVDGSRGDGGVSDDALKDAVADPTVPPRYKADAHGGTYVYKGRDATVSLNGRGEIVTAWPRTEGGRRIPR